jgi:hypothetical protein
MPTRQVPEQLLQGFSAAARYRNLRGVGTRKLKENVGAYCQNRGTHLGVVMVQELVGRYDENGEFSGLAKHGVEPAAVGHEVFHLVAIEGEELTPLAREEGS